MSQGKKHDQLQVVLPMSADAQFQRMDKTVARKQLGLPQDCKLVGYCGSAHESRDMEVFFEAMDILAQRHPDYRVVMTGFVQKGIQLPAIIIHLGYLPDMQMPVMINALDVMVSVNKPSVFGNYSYPAKIYEALACGVPVIASATPSVAEVLDNDPMLLVPPGNAAVLAERIERLLAGDLEITLPEQANWRATGAGLYQLLVENTH
jgi:glycosyltransferase involved in cell wall biosynthesis